MKKLLFIAVSAFSINSFAQPVIVNGNNIPAVGFSASVSTVQSSSTDITNTGANHTWDFGTYTFQPVGTMQVIAPSSAPMGSSFLSANYAFSFAGTYSFFNVSGTKNECLASTITGAGSGNDYSPNPKTLLKFPFNYNDTDTDTWQKVGDSPNTITFTYDGYGTLITPFGTYTDVVRVHENYGVGDDDYRWYILNPLTEVAIYEHSTTTLYAIGATQVPTNMEEHGKHTVAMSVYPNPANSTVTIANISNGSLLVITDITGRVLHTEEANAETVTMNVDQFGAGVYLVKVENENSIAVKKLIIQ